MSHSVFVLGVSILGGPYDGEKVKAAGVRLAPTIHLPALCERETEARGAKPHAYKLAHYPGTDGPTFAYVHESLELRSETCRMISPRERPVRRRTIEAFAKTSEKYLRERYPDFLPDSLRRIQTRDAQGNTHHTVTIYHLVPTQK